MEMCLAWGKTPDEIERVSWHTRQRMWRFWIWKHERENIIQERAQMNTRR